jgi:hypothetical protein
MAGSIDMEFVVVGWIGWIKLDKLDMLDKTTIPSSFIQPIQLYLAYLALSSLSITYLNSNPSLIIAPFLITTIPSLIENSE